MDINITQLCDLWPVGVPLLPPNPSTSPHDNGHDDHVVNHGGSGSSSSNNNNSIIILMILLLGMGADELSGGEIEKCDLQRAVGTSAVG
jgi:hypothetical protein